MKTRWSILGVAVGALLIAGCRERRAASNQPDHSATTTQHASSAPADASPADAVGPFYVGVSSLDVEANDRAARLFEELTKKLPDEPAVWANLGLARLKLGDLPGAEQALATAAKLAPGNAAITVLQATVDDDEGKFEQAIQRLRSVPEPNVTVLYRIADLLGRTGKGADLPAQLQAFDQMLRLQPTNPVVAFSRARLLARMENKPLLIQALHDIETHREGWGAAALHQFEAAKTAADAGNFRAAASALTFLQNLSLATPSYQAALAAIEGTGGTVGRPIRQFIKYHEPVVGVATADTALRFSTVADKSISATPAYYAAADINAKGAATLLSVVGDRLHVGHGPALVLPTSSTPRSRQSLAVADLNGDYLPDLIWVDHNGLKIWLADAAGQFTAQEPAAESRAVFARPGHGVWAVDFDADGDLDLLIARDGAAPELLRNNGDGTYTALNNLESMPEIRAACWTDLDGDGVPDLAVIDTKGRVLVSWNDRAGSFTAPKAISDTPALALAYGDVLGLGEMSLVVLEPSGDVRAFAFDHDQRALPSRLLGHWSDAPDLNRAGASGQVSISIADLDNNGASDVVTSAGNTCAVWLNQGRGEFVRGASAPAMFVTSIGDTDNDGLLDLVGTTANGAAVAHTSSGKHYHWQSIQTRSLGPHADSRINSFGLGGRIEIRAGPLLAMAAIASPRTHFGLGTQKEVGLARIVWPNGVAQVEFSPPADQDVMAVQRLKGSCPWVFTRTNGEFRFVKDFIWRSPLGMRINSQDTAGVDQTKDWILIPGADLSADHGAYEVRITAELWETHFFDKVALRVVDHPADVSAFVDERFVPTAQPRLAVIATTHPQPFAAVRNQAGRDVAAIVAATDGRTVSDFPLGRFQGIADDHWVEFEVPAAARANEPVVLIGTGWIYPTDSSLNVAISQGNNPAPHGLVLEAFDPGRGWVMAADNLGFPAGKNKTVVIPIPHDSLAAGRRRFRLRTNLEIYWDYLGWAVERPASELKITPAPTQVADLRYRGFTELGAPERRRPDLPVYARLAGSGPRWQDLEGFHTRFGDVRELLQATDDRYVIMNAGDEMVFRFAAPPPPPPGWTRDFVLVGDGWVKDGDFNTANSRTVIPLPSHSIRNYGTPNATLETDPVYREHRDDWQRFHTRYVTPTSFERGLMQGVAATTNPEGAR